MCEKCMFAFVLSTFAHRDTPTPCITRGRSISGSGVSRQNLSSPKRHQVFGCDDSKSTILYSSIYGFLLAAIMACRSMQ